MDDHLRRWLLAALGPATDTTDLDQRYARLQSGRAVALEVLRERRAGLLAQPLKVSVSGVVSVDNSANLAALERQIAELEDPATPAPDETGPDQQPTSGVLYLHERPRR
ncbi:hypothetical protein [Streptomyces ipomoeae]|uniref:hypothetical protein n=1 Tax=Streptomyces ipomoeae TaxID=103232 RepID=UPI0011465257|nr:hypothetical protein [Streptomyces ipomoeae]TQE33059.1 hypothetical protein Sipo7851_21385 [Streptomyces ipomoeae]